MPCYRAVLRRRAALCCLAALWCVVGCRDAGQAQRPDGAIPSAIGVGQATETRDAQLLATLREFEGAQRRDAPWVSEQLIDARGSDPYRLLATRSSAGLSYWGLLRRASRLVKLDPRGRELESYSAPPGALALAAGGDYLLLAGELSSQLVVYPLRAGPGEPGLLRLPGPAVLRGLAYFGGDWYGTEELTGQLVRLKIRPRLDGSAQGRAVRVVAAPRSVTLEPVAPCRGGSQVEATSRWLVANCLLDHSLLIYSREQLSATAHEPPRPQRFQLDGPIWGFALWEHSAGLVVAAGGVEDAPLDRSIGSFGNIDSFVYSVEVSAAGIRRTGQINVSELGIVLPKAMLVSGTGSTRQLRVTGYATPGVLHAELSSGGLANVELRDRGVPPGTTAMLEAGDGLLLANPLLDVWIRVERRGEVSTAAPAEALKDTRSPNVRLGEALFFTTLMAPHNRSAGKLSRFTCETCHFEGHTDGRTHATGRGAIHATTKSLLGLVSNPPYFTRALDADLARMVHSEFRVAGANSGTDPRFELVTADVEWVRHLGVKAPRVAPIELRQALLEFLVHFNYGPHPRLAQRAQPAEFSEAERRGAGLFEVRCERCHQARRTANDPGSRVPPEAWLKELSANAGLVWARDGYEQAGVVPYVHPQGARPSSLRRLYKKAPYFTNGAAETLQAVLAEFAFQDSGTLGSDPQAAHLGAPVDWRRLSAAEQADLFAFLSVL